MVSEELKDKIDYLFSRVNWKDSSLDAKAIDIVNSLKKDIEENVKNEAVAICVKFASECYCEDGKLIGMGAAETTKWFIKHGLIDEN